MFEKLKANILFHRILKRPNIEKAYAMVGPEDSWYDTITKVHNSLAEIQRLPHEILEISSHDCLKLKGVYYPGDSDKTVICCHGYTSHGEREWAFPGLFYHSMGFNVLIPYQRAHGLSEGKYLSFGALEHKDMMRWVDRINEMYPNGQILIHGLSMGGGIVLCLASKKMQNVKCLISDAPNDSIEGFLRGVNGRVFKQNAVWVYPHLRSRFQKEFGCDPADFDYTRSMAYCQYPILLCAGENEHLDKLFRLLKYQNTMDTEVVILPGCNHGNGMYKQTEMYQGAIKAFVAKHMTL